MTEPQETQQATEADGGTQPAETGGQEPQEAPSREAARYRTRLREVETERDSLTQRVRGYEATDVQRQVADRLADPADLWQHTSLDDLRGDDGAVDPEKVNQAADELVERKPHYGLRSRTPKPDPSQGARAGGSPEEPRLGAIFSGR